MSTVLSPEMLRRTGGREIRVVDDAAAKEFNSNPKKYIRQIDMKMIMAQMPYYPMDTCVVSGEKLGGDMGKPVERIFNNRLVRFCCSDCPNDFAKDPGKYLKKLDAAVIEKQAKNYPLDHSVVSPEKKLGEGGAKPVNVIVGNELIEVADKTEAETVRKDPVKYLAMLNAAKAKSALDQAGEGKVMEMNDKADKEMKGMSGTMKDMPGMGK